MFILNLGNIAVTKPRGCVPLLLGSYIAAILSRGRTQSLMALGVYPTLWPKTAVLWPSGFSVVVDHADQHR